MAEIDCKCALYACIQGVVRVFHRAGSVDASTNQWKIAPGEYRVSILYFIHTVLTVMFALINVCAD